MKFRSGYFVGALLLPPVLAFAKPLQLKSSVYSPQAGVICDKKGGFCADSEGIAVALTKMYLANCCFDFCNHDAEYQWLG